RHGLAVAELTPPPAPVVEKPAKKAKSPKRMNVGDLDTDTGTKKAIEFLRRRQCRLTPQQFQAMEELASKIKGNDSGAVAANGLVSPSQWVVDALGASQLPIGAIEWVLRSAYPFPAPWDRDASDDESLSTALLRVAIAVTKERFVFLPKGRKAFDRKEREII